jgi:hypothetical protein
MAATMSYKQRERKRRKKALEPTVAELTYDACPPSLNRIGSRGQSHWAYTRAKRDWQDIVGGMLMVGAVPRGLTYMRFDATLRFPVRRTRDAGNFGWLLDKACGDAAVAGGWLRDDNPDYYEFGGVTFDSTPGAPRTTLRVAYRT